MRQKNYFFQIFRHIFALVSGVSNEYWSPFDILLNWRTGTLPATRMPTTIENLPDFPALQQIQSALWGTADTRGAAVLVGAGFSRNAVLPAPNSPKPPLWSDYHRVMKERLYTGPSVKRAPSDPLRLAEEYKSVLGPAALDSLIYDLVRDGEWQPGPLHEKLVSFPWTDILTTNWDTLLERAAETNDQQTYEIVRTIADIPRTQSPRIVKLHGSMPSNRPFIFTEEDYRTFPRKFAPFVNLVQQVLMENELCLIGFSGDDPNFLQWSGWIRDQLGDSARRIYLIGVLNLPLAHRKYLEARRVIPVDLAPLVDNVDEHDEKHAAASVLFLDFLMSSKPRPPSEWPSEESVIAEQRDSAIFYGGPTQTDFVAVISRLLANWRKERETYPGWLVCPSSKRTQLTLGTHAQIEFALRKSIERLRAAERANALYEIAFRLDLAFAPLSPWLREQLSKTVEDTASTLDRRQRCELASILIRIAREERDRPSFDRWTLFLQNNGGSDKDVLATAAYEACLWARDDLDYDSLAALAPTIEGSDPAWKIRRAALHYDFGDSEAARRLAIGSLREARGRYIRDRKSIWNISRLGWALFLARVGEKGDLSPSLRDVQPLITSTEWPAYFAANKCSPWDELYELDRKVSEAFRTRLESSQTETPRFDAGSYTKSIRFSNSLGSAYYDVPRLADTVGLPAEAGSWNVMRSRLSRAIELSVNFDEGDLLRVIRVLKSPSDALIEKAFGRIQVARMSLKTVESLIRKLRRAINFGRMRFVMPSDAQSRFPHNFWVDRVQVFVEVMSRLVVRFSGEQAVAAFREAASFAKAPEWIYWPLFEPLGNLLERSFTAVSPKDRQALLLEIINLPLPDERGIGQSNASGPLAGWPELFLRIDTKAPPRVSDDLTFTSRVSVLISKINKGDPFTRERAAIRLLFLHKINALTPQESISFGQAIWSQGESEVGLPVGISLRAHAAFDFPGGNVANIARRFESGVVDKALSGTIDAEFLAAVAGATRLRSDGTRWFTLSTDQALRLFDSIVRWRPRTVEINLDGSTSEMRRLAGAAIVGAVLPFVSAEQFGKERIDTLIGCIQSGILPSLVIALPEIVKLDNTQEKAGLDLILKTSFHREADVAVHGLSAIQRWRYLSLSGGLSKVPRQLREAVLTLVVSAREPGLLAALHLAAKFVADGDCNEDELRELANALDRIWAETAYSAWDTENRRTITVTLVRARCVRLAEQLRRAGVTHPAIGSWLDEARVDPVPEVRYALEEPEE